MNPLLQEAVGAIVRWALAMAAGYLVRAGIWDSASAATYVSAATLGVLSIAWTLYQRYRSRLKLLTALSMALPMTEEVLDAHLAAGFPTPSTTTPKTQVPVA